MTAGSRQRNRHRPGNGALLVIAAFLILSGAARLGVGAAEALNSGATQAEPQTTPSTSNCEPDGGTMALLAELRARETRLAAREAQEADRAKALELAKATIDAQMEALAAAEAKLAATLTLADQAADKDVAGLIAVYEKMKPKDAARLFEEMAPDFAAGFIARMRPEAAASVMTGLEPKTAYTISVILAGRNANAPKE
ncbi:MAG: hypothetical protein R3E44_03510 [Paracoccaceae bacterium]